MNPILQAAVEIQEFFVEKKWAFCFIGGIAVLRWGQPRTTQDVDVSLFVPLGEENEIVASILEKFAPRIPNADRFAIEARVILAKSTQDVAYDIALAHFEFEKEIIERATWFEFLPNINLLTISAEDLVVLKSFAGRDQDWNDVRGIVSANQELDVEFIKRNLKQLDQIQPENSALEKLQRLLE